MRLRKRWRDMLRLAFRVLRAYRRRGRYEVWRLSVDFLGAEMCEDAGRVIRGAMPSSLNANGRRKSGGRLTQPCVTRSRELLLLLPGFMHRGGDTLLNQQLEMRARMLKNDVHHTADQRGAVPLPLPTATPAMSLFERRNLRPVWPLNITCGSPSCVNGWLPIMGATSSAR